MQRGHPYAARDGMSVEGQVCICMQLKPRLVWAEAGHAPICSQTLGHHYQYVFMCVCVCAWRLHAEARVCRGQCMQWPVCRGTVLYAEALYAEAPYAELYAVCSKYAAYAANMQRMLTDAYAQKKLYAAYAAGALPAAGTAGSGC